MQSSVKLFFFHFAYNIFDAIHIHENILGWIHYIISKIPS